MVVHDLAPSFRALRAASSPSIPQQPKTITPTLSRRARETNLRAQSRGYRGCNRLVADPLGGPFIEIISPEGFTEHFVMTGGENMVVEGTVDFDLQKSVITYTFNAVGMQDVDGFDPALPSMDAFNFVSSPGFLESCGKTVMFSGQQHPLVVEVQGEIVLDNPEGELPFGLDMLGVTTFAVDGPLSFVSRVAIAQEHCVE